MTEPVSTEDAAPSGPSAAPPLVADTGLKSAAKQTWDSLLPTTRRKLLISGVFGFVLAVVDAGAVGLLPTLVDRVDGAGGGWLGSLSVPVLGALIGGLLLVKSLAGAALVFWQSHFLARDEGEHTIDLFAHFLRQPYETLSAKNTNDIVRDLHVSMPMLYRGGALGLGLGLVDGLSLLLLVVVVLVQSPITGGALGVLAIGSGAAYSIVIRRPVASLGDRMLSQTADVLRDMTEGLDSVKTVKAFGIEPTVIGRFTRSRRLFETPMRDYMAYQQLSRYYLEVALVVVLGACVAIVYVVEGRDAVFGIVGLLGGVAARAMPAMARLLNSITNIRVAGSVVDSLREDLSALGEPPADTAGAASPALVTSDEDVMGLEDVTFQYRSATTPALSSVSMQVRTGEIVAVLGGSGSGKTSLVDVMIGLLRPSSGTVRFPATSVGYVAQETFVWDEGIGFNVSLGRPSPSGDQEEEVWSALSAAHLSDWARSLPDALGTALGERGSRMSGGQRQRLGIARALYGGPAFLVLDEPTSSLDTTTSRAILQTLEELKHRVGIVVVTHDPLVVEYADRSVELEQLQRR